MLLPPEFHGAALVGCAGWTIPKLSARHFPVAGSHLERFASVFGAAEINSSFYRPHQASTYARWAASTPAAFRFSVKLPKALSHEARLAEPDAVLDRFAGEAGALGDKLGCVLVQLPPKLGLTWPSPSASSRPCASASAACWPARRATRTGSARKRRPC